MLWFLVRLSDRLDIDLLEAAELKLAENAKKYPADKVQRRRPKIHRVLKGALPLSYRFASGFASAGAGAGASSGFTSTGAVRSRNQCVTPCSFGPT